MIFQPVWVVLVPAAALLGVAAYDLIRAHRRASLAERLERCSLVMVCLLMVAVGLRPTATREVEVPVPSPVDLVVLLDRTASMGALDGPGDAIDRITAAGVDLTELVAATGGAYVTVVVFDDEARVAVPATTDLNAVSTFFATVGWRPSTKAVGSDISVAVPVARAALEAAAEQRPDNQRYLVYAGDGEQTLAAAPASFAELSGMIDDSLVLGYGSQRGAPIPVAPGEKETIEIEGVEQMSVPDHDALEAIAADLGGTFALRSGGGDVPEFAVAERVTRVEVRPGDEYYWWFAAAATPFLTYLLGASLVRVRRAREEMR